ncbi:MAG TPA: NosD domain-containing protein, partial [Acidimicrobiales bacterium]|nr:NosD domain-containing protein [Acidimicrobiales bacterium]
MLRKTIGWHSAVAAVLIAGGPSALAATLLMPAAQAQTLPATSYVSPAGATGAADDSCADAAFSSIQAAVDGTASGGTVVVCAGTYDESVTVTKLLTLQGLAGSIIDAKGAPYGIGIAYSQVVVTGLTVEGAVANTKTNAPGDGIITAGFVDGKPVTSNDDVIVSDVTKDNEGAGIDLNSTTGSIAAHDVSDGNGVGINLSNDLGMPDSHNDVAGNVTDDNPGGCGIVLADHTGAGVFDNVIVGNTSEGNGLGTPSRPNASSGSGVILAAASKTGGVWGNTIQSNKLIANGHAGVAVHAHVPGLDFAGNRIVDNTIGTNNERTDY